MNCIVEVAGLKAAFKKFMSEEFEEACLNSTKASWSGSGFSVELFEDGSYRSQWNNNFGNLYDSPGMILGIPCLGEEDADINGSVIENPFFDNVQQEIEDTFTFALQDYQATDR